MTGELSFNTPAHLLNLHNDVAVNDCHSVSVKWRIKENFFSQHFLLSDWSVWLLSWKRVRVCVCGCGGDVQSARSQILGGDQNSSRVLHV